MHLATAKDRGEGSWIIKLDCKLKAQYSVYVWNYGIICKLKSKMFDTNNNHLVLQ